MSRAFVRDFEDTQLPELPQQVSPLPPGAKNYLTPGGARRLREELDRLHQERPRHASAPVDDLDGRRELQAIDQRIRYLTQSLANAEIRQPEGPPEVVQFGATVTIREKDGSESTYRIVGVDEIDLERNWVSWQSPIGRALLTARQGETVRFKAPRGEKELQIVRVAYDE